MFLLSCKTLKATKQKNFCTTNYSHNLKLFKPCLIHKRKILTALNHWRVLWRSQFLKLEPPFLFLDLKVLMTNEWVSSQDCLVKTYFWAVLLTFEQYYSKYGLYHKIEVLICDVMFQLLVPRCGELYANWQLGVKKAGVPLPYELC